MSETLIKELREKVERLREANANMLRQMCHIPVGDDKERELFEEIYWRAGIPTNMTGSREAFFARKSDGSYKLSHVEGAWWGWRAGKGIELKK